ncbi:hypothetical protein ACFWFF_15385, partial [Streptomyces sp. NPDC060223]|uniref:hypothetical protein n=1 Tax=Streptomyces sp. NPDC060223 TaxID=3347077 RepID=UPI00365E1674
MPGASRRRVLGATGASLALAAGLPGVADAADLSLLGTYGARHDLIRHGQQPAAVPVDGGIQRLLP